MDPSNPSRQILIRYHKPNRHLHSDIWHQKLPQVPAPADSFHRPKLPGRALLIYGSTGACVSSVLYFRYAFRCKELSLVIFISLSASSHGVPHIY
jgi:hypothetical protein